jgi:hypothetical protein
VLVIYAFLDLINVRKIEHVEIYYKCYCSILRKVIREAGKLSYKDLIDTSENTVKTNWNIINNVTGKTDKSKHMSPLFKIGDKETLLENAD